MRVLCDTHEPDPRAADALPIAASSDSQETGGRAIAFLVASRITHVPSGAQYSFEMLRTTITRADRCTLFRNSQTASRAE